MRADFRAMGLSLMRHWGLDGAESFALAAPSPDFAEVVGAASFDAVGASFGAVTLESLLAGVHAARSDAPSTKGPAKNEKALKRITGSPPTQGAFYSRVLRCEVKSMRALARSS